MKLFFRRRSIKKVFGLLSVLGARPFILKVFLLFALLAATLYFKSWAERQEGYPLFFPPSVRQTAAKPPLPSPPSITPPQALPLDLINVNTASSKELESLPGIGPKLAEEITQNRLRNGPFIQAEDLLRVKGMGFKKLHGIESYLRFKD